MKLLLIEDDAQVAAEIRSALQARGYSVEHHSDGRHGQEAALLGDHSVIITDRMLPGVDGLDIVNTLRRSGKSTPVLVLSALDSVDERVKGLRAGGDDYLGKPFSIEELVARVESLQRRVASSARRSMRRGVTPQACHERRSGGELPYTLWPDLRVKRSPDRRP